MLTLLEVDGFKNLSKVSVRLGPFTCVAGANGVGKSNLFDAIRFLSALASRPLVEAALCVRDESGKRSDIASLFSRSGVGGATEMRFRAEMIVPERAVDDFGQEAEASTTFLRYDLTLRYRDEEGAPPAGLLEVVEESLVHLKQGDAARHLRFPHNTSTWRKSVLHGRHTTPFISTEKTGAGVRSIRLHQDRNSGRPLPRPAATLTRTILSAANGAESPTVLCAKREMESWQMLQLEPAALRRPDEFTAPTRLGTDGSHLAATLYRLAHGAGADAIQVCTRVANRLSELIGDVKEVSVDRDEKRELYSVFLRGKDGTRHPARSLSDGTLRFLALTVLELDTASGGLICLEEPENGIHPDRIPAIIRLLKDICTDAEWPVDATNPLRQVIINTHSPSVVAEVSPDDLLIADLFEFPAGEERAERVAYLPLADTWRVQPDESQQVAPRGKLTAYLNPIQRTRDSEIPVLRRIADMYQLVFPWDDAKAGR